MLNKLVLAATFVVAGFAHNASAAGWVNSPAIQGTAGCGAGTATQIGYFDSGSGLHTGDIAYVHIVAVAGCAFDSVGFDLFLPPGVTPAVSATNPVFCFRDNAAYANNTLGDCSQTPITPSNFGGLFYGWSKLNPNESFELQIPVFWGAANPGLVEAVMTSITAETPVISPPVAYRPQVNNQAASSVDGTSVTTTFDPSNFFVDSQVAVEYGVGAFDHVSASLALSSQFEFYTGTTIPLPNTTPGTAVTWRVRITNTFGTFYGPTNTIVLPAAVLPLNPQQPITNPPPACRIKKCFPWGP